ncbi:MAG: hypothetical protein IJI49_04210 [Bacilli bacterium]|nr:hypothetical protein [Bacilli bacterium]
MAAMDQSKLTSMCTSLKEAASDYEEQIVLDAKQIVEEFNENWVSNSARSLANEIGEKIKLLETDIASKFNEKSAEIRRAVANFNLVEGESINYPGFNFGIPSISMELAATLNGGKLGVKEGADISSIETPMQTLIDNVKKTLENILTTVKSCDAFDSDEVTSLTNSVNKIKSDFETDMETLKSSLTTRMSREISERETLEKANKEILQ